MAIYVIFLEIFFDLFPSLREVCYNDNVFTKKLIFATYIGMSRFPQPYYNDLLVLSAGMNIEHCYYIRPIL